MANETTKSGKTSTVDETTPLLVSSEVGPTALPNEDALVDAQNHHQDRVDDDDDDDEGPPLPKAQIMYLCFARVVEPIAFFSIFPYINQMIEDTGSVAASDVGFYSGLIESLFSLTQMLLMIPWGRAADRVGRKPVLVGSLCGVTIATTLFGLSKTIWQMILFRCLAGVFAGTIVTIRAMITEHSTHATQARAFSFFSFAGNLGIFLGPLLGGALADPVKQYPSVFGQVQLFKDYPYFLPTICTGAVSACATIVTVLFVKETLHHKEHQGSETTPPMSTFEVITSPGVSRVLYIYGHVMLLGLAYTAVYPVFMYTPVKLGGMEFSPLLISLFMGFGGLFQAIWGLAVFPPLTKKIGTGGILRLMSLIWPPDFLVHPLSNFLLKHHMMVAFWFVACSLLFIGSTLSMAFTAVQLALNDIAPSHATLGTLNAVALSLVSGIRAVAPALFGSLYATGVRKHILDGYLGWIILAVLTLPLAVAVRWLPEKAEGRPKVAPPVNGWQDLIRRDRYVR